MLAEEVVEEYRKYPSFNLTMKDDRARFILFSYLSRGKLLSESRYYEKGITSAHENTLNMNEKSISLRRVNVDVETHRLTANGRFMSRTSQFILKLR